MRRVVCIHKPVGLTPLQAIEEFRLVCPEYSECKLGYAGRLDPMARGVLVVLVGDENLKRKEYERLAKEYEFEVLLGVSSDTYDVMGKIMQVGCALFSEEQIQGVLDGFVGAWEQEYPTYSSAIVSGHPLYWWARHGRISEISIPKKKVCVESVELIEMRRVLGREIVHDVEARVSVVQGEFRQEEVLRDWEEFSSEFGDELFVVARVRLSCSSGVYVRGIADVVGARLGVGAVAYSILRTRVGEFDLSSCISLGSIKQ